MQTSNNPIARIIPIYLLLAASAAIAQVSTFAGNAQHTSNYAAPAQNLAGIRWSTPIDLSNSGVQSHYGAPLVSSANTVFVPVKNASGGYQVSAFNGSNGSLKYTLPSDYILPTHNWIPSYQPVLVNSPTGLRLYYPGSGGTIYYIASPDTNSSPTPVQQVFYTTLVNYQANAAAFNAAIFLDTPITSDANGNIFFGFRIQGTAPAPLNTTQSGFARIDPNGIATYVLAGAAAADSSIALDSHNSAPALSNDGSTVYVPVKSASTEYYGYLLGLDSTTLATKFKVFLADPRYGVGAGILDDSTASPLVAPDGDVYFGVYSDPNNGSRGFLLHFSSDLTVQKLPGGFGWDYTPGIVPISMVPSYTGSSPYLILSKYNNYANAGGDGDGVNRIAILDPFVPQTDPHSNASNLKEMREVLTVIGPTADIENRSSTFPQAVREWCINSPAINPATYSIFTPSEDGRIYRWNMLTNSLTQFLTLGVGVGEPYVPTVIGPDGTLYGMNGGTLFAIGSPSNVSLTLSSMNPSTLAVVAGDTVSFAVTVANTGSTTKMPTGTVTLADTVYSVSSSGTLITTTHTLGVISLDATGHASYTTSSLTADSHFISASYSGDANFPAGTASLVQKIHANATSTTVTVVPNPPASGKAATFTVAVSSVPSNAGVPSGMVTLQTGAIILGQAALNSGGITFDLSSWQGSSQPITATYASDFTFASSSATLSAPGNATSTTVTSTPNPSAFAQAVTLAAAVTSAAGTPVGALTFSEGTNVLAANLPLDGSGRATFAVSTLTPGSHTITAVFNGATSWSNSTGSITQSVTGNTITSVTSSLNPSSVGQAVTVTATITSSATGTPTGAVTFSEGAKVYASNVAVNSSGHATFTTSTLTTGTHSITAAFTGSNGWQNSSGGVSETVQGDTIPPSQPTSVTATSGPNTRQISVSWHASTDNIGVNHYEVWRATSSSASYSQIAAPATTSYVDTLSSRRQTRWYYIVAVDAAGNRSTPSAKVSGISR